MAEDMATQAVDVLGAGAIFPASQPVSIELPPDLGEGHHFAYRCVPSPGKGILPPRRVRRLGRSQELALTAAHCAVGSCIAPPDLQDRGAVSVGTGWGELGNTADFLKDMIAPEQLAPKPTYFINSVHNSMASEIAIDFRMMEANHTFTHNAISFESALAEAMRMLWKGHARYALAAGVDKGAPYILPAGFGQGSWRRDEGPLSPLEAAPGNHGGTLPGEGAAAFILAREGAVPKNQRFARIAIVRARPLRPADITPISQIDAAQEAAFAALALGQCGLSPSEAGFLLLGANGEPELDSAYRRVLEAMSTAAGHPLGYGVYKHGCGEFATASALGLALAIDMVRTGEAPEGLRVLKAAPTPGSVENVLLYHLSPAGYHSLCVVTA